jgi:hypothetical protein
MDIVGAPVGTVTLRSTILAGNTAAANPDISAVLVSQGHNLIGVGDGASGYAGTDLVGTPDNPIDPGLGSLQNNGGPTATMALLPGSRAIGAGDTTDAPAFDQRGPGFARVVHGTVDIGAFQVQPAVAPSVESVTINYSSDEPSRVTGLTVTFHGVVTFDPDAFQLQRLGYGLVDLSFTSSVVGDQTVVVITFTDSLPDGVYTFTVRADGVHDASGQTLTDDNVTTFVQNVGDNQEHSATDMVNHLEADADYSLELANKGDGVHVSDVAINRPNYTI